MSIHNIFCVEIRKSINILLKRNALSKAMVNKHTFYIDAVTLTNLWAKEIVQ